MKDSLKEAALEYAGRGWVTLPVSGKVPTLKEWHKLDIADTAASIEQRFYGNCNGIGILCGPRSGNLLVMDIDDPALIDAFRQKFPALATYAVSTPSGGAHFYIQLTSGVVAIGLKFKGGELRYTGMQVVAPPSPGYTLEASTLSACNQDDFNAILAWTKGEAISAPKQPVIHQPTVWIAGSGERSPHLVHYEQLVREHSSRNEGLFRAALLARDTGVAAADYAAIVAPTFLATAPLRSQRSETYEQRHREMIATVKSAYSRPARQIGNPKARLWDSIRERCAQTRAMCVWRVLDALYARLPVNSVITRREAIAALEEVVGRDSVIQALEWSGGTLFQKKVLPLYPTPKATQSAKQKLPIRKRDCVAVGAKNQEKQKSRTNNPTGRRAFLYTIPSVHYVARCLGISRKAHRYSTPMRHTSSKEARMMLYRGKIERKPGKYANVALATWLGVCKQTVKNYDKALKIHKQPQYDECPVHTWNIDKLPFVDEPKFGLWLSANGKRYPALQPIAAKLLQYGLHPVLMRQLPNHLHLGGLEGLKARPTEQPQLVQPSDKLSKPTPQPKPSRVAVSHEKPLKPTPQPKPSRAAAHRPKFPAMLELKQLWADYEPRWEGDIEGRIGLMQSAYLERGFGGWVLDVRGFRPSWLNHATPRAFRQWLVQLQPSKRRQRPKPRMTMLEEAARNAVIRDVQAFTTINLEGKPQRTLSRRRIVALFEQFGEREVRHVTAYLSKRNNIRNPAGILISALYSNAAANEMERKVREWLKQ